MLEEPLKKIDELIAGAMVSNVTLVNKISSYLLKFKGKRIRTKLLLLACQEYSKIHDRSMACGAAVELLHAATLLHDDVIDGSLLRRSHKTSNAIWGNSAAILTGDFFYSLAFQLLIKTKSLEIMSIIANGARKITESEVWQLSMVGNLKMPVDTYLHIIYGKTASLFEVSMRCGAILGNATTKQQNLMSIIGKQLGMAFQLTDDNLDYCGKKNKWTKNIGDDLAEGKVTLPLIYFLKTANKKDKQRVVDLIKSDDTIQIKDKPEFKEIHHLIASSEGIDRTKLLATDYYNQAKHNINKLKNDISKPLLLEIADIAINRSS